MKKIVAWTAVALFVFTIPESIASKNVGSGDKDSKPPARMTMTEPTLSNRAKKRAAAQAQNLSVKQQPGVVHNVTPPKTPSPQTSVYDGVVDESEGVSSSREEWPSLDEAASLSGQKESKVDDKEKEENASGMVPIPDDTLSKQTGEGAVASPARIGSPVDGNAIVGVSVAKPENKDGVSGNSLQASEDGRDLSLTQNSLSKDDKGPVNDLKSVNQMVSVVVVPGATESLPVKKGYLGLAWEYGYYYGSQVFVKTSEVIGAVTEASSDAYTRMTQTRLHRYVAKKPRLTFGMVLNELKGGHRGIERTAEELRKLKIEDVLYKHPIIYKTSDDQDSRFYLVGINQSFCDIAYAGNVSGDSIEEKNRSILSLYLSKLTDLEGLASTMKEIDEKAFLSPFTVTTTQTPTNVTFFNDIVAFLISFPNVKIQFRKKYGDYIPEVKKLLQPTMAILPTEEEFYVRYFMTHDLLDLKLRADDVEKDVFNWALGEKCYIDPRKGHGCFFPKSGSKCTVLAPSFLVYDGESGKIKKLSFVYYRIKREHLLNMSDEEMRKYFLGFRKADFPADIRIE